MDPNIVQHLIGDSGVQIGSAEHVTVVNQPKPESRGLGHPGGFRASYRGQISGFESRHAPLHDRGEELDDLRELIDTDGYVVVEGDSWSGKTALLTALGRRLRADGVPSVQFFVIRRHSDTSSSFLAAANTQLLELLGESGGLPPTPAEQSNQLSELWAAVAERDVRVVLVVDGLDEQDQDDPVTAHLPFSCPPGVAIVTSTRPLPDIRRAVPAEHELACVPSSRHRTLRPSTHARIERDAADDALDQALTGDDDLVTSIAGFLAFGRGPLRASELGALCDTSPGRVRQRLAHVERLLRVVRAEPDEEPAFAFSHAELEERARAWLGDRAERSYTDGILAWSDGYQDLGWPTDTPAYLVETLDAITLRAAWRGDHLVRLVQLVGRSRGRLLRTRLGHAQPALETARAARTKVASSSSPDWHLWFQLSVAEHEHRSGHNDVPTDVIAALAATGQIDTALEVASASTDPWGSNDHQLAAIAAAIAGTDPVRAATLCQSIEDPEPMAVVAEAMVGIDDELALEIALGIGDVKVRSRAQFNVIAGSGGVDVERAMALTAGMDAHERIWAQADLASRLADIDEDRALRFARGIPDHGARAAAISGVIAVAGRLDAIDEALGSARTLADPEDRAEAMGIVAQHVAAVDANAAVAIAEAIPLEDEKSYAMARIAVETARFDLEEAMRTCALVDDDHARMRGLADIATAASIVDVDEALRISSLIADDQQRASTVADIAALVAEDDVDRALEIAGSPDVADMLDTAALAGRIQALSGIARATSRADVASDALAACESIKRPPEALVAVVAPVAQFDVDLALHVLEHVRKDVPVQVIASTLTSVVRTVARADPDRALEVVRHVAPEQDRDRLLVQLVAVVAESDRARAEKILAEVTIDDLHEEAIVALSIAVAQSDVDDALRLITSLSSADRQVRGLAGLVSQTGREDLTELALELAEELPSPYEQNAARARVAIAVARHDVDRARSIAPRFLDDKTARARVLSGIARSAAANDLDRAVVLATDSLYERWDHRVFFDLAVAASTTRLDRALELAEGNAVALGRIACRTGIVGIAADALERALEVSNDANRARVLAVVAGYWPDPGVRQSMLEWLVDRWLPGEPTGLENSYGGGGVPPPLVS